MFLPNEIMFYVFCIFSIFINKLALTASFWNLKCIENCLSSKWWFYGILMQLVSFHCQMQMSSIHVSSVPGNQVLSPGEQRAFWKGATTLIFSQTSQKVLMGIKIPPPCQWRVASLIIFLFLIYYISEINSKKPFLKISSGAPVQPSYLCHWYLL